MVSLHSSGSEATFFAMRLARVYRKRDKILKFEGAYHGMNDYAMMSNQWTMGSPPYPKAVPNTHGHPRALNERSPDRNPSMTSKRRRRSSPSTATSLPASSSNRCSAPSNPGRASCKACAK